MRGYIYVLCKCRGVSYSQAVAQLRAMSSSALSNLYGSFSADELKAYESMSNCSDREWGNIAAHYQLLEG